MIESDADVPLLPFDGIPIDLPTWSLRLDDVVGLEIVSEVSFVFSVVVSLQVVHDVRILRSGIDDLDYFAIVEINPRVNA
ncbi:hypothetical protein C497_06399 [Halalkalicoccus jeotgali B3]|uniref:Uncharacterized protein n=1 Tax=Halalkalicoccus jeotgali (strain DSM 18796 / CECT 7217 / JCM 14584 / KCTC 4019 / B3) TaxID=795797 RepID=L9VP08_HALJB|nr:hypothetical protein C497_06399 [Halalkalicoccus jeotgali B3]